MLALAGWINRQQQEVIDYLRAENRVLKQSHGKKRIRLNDDQRRRLAVKGKSLGRKMLGEIATIVTPDTILRWHRQLVAQKWDYSYRRKKVGQPRVSRDIVALVLRIARDNPACGYDRIEGALANRGHKISDTTVANILREHGIEPVPERKRQATWKELLKAHWDVLGATDFTTIEVWTKGGLVTIYLLFVMEVATRRVHFAGPYALVVHIQGHCGRDPRGSRFDFRRTVSAKSLPGSQAISERARPRGPSICMLPSRVACAHVLRPMYTWKSVDAVARTAGQVTVAVQ